MSEEEIFMYRFKVGGKKDSFCTSKKNAKFWVDLEVELGNDEVCVLQIHRWAKYVHSPLWYGPPQVCGICIGIFIYLGTCFEFSSFNHATTSAPPSNQALC